MNMVQTKSKMYTSYVHICILNANMFHYSNEISLLSLKKPTKILQKMDTTRRHALNSQDKKKNLQTFFQQIPVIPPPHPSPLTSMH